LIKIKYKNFINIFNIRIMSESNDVVIVSSDEKYVWNANDWSNLITISASAIASVLLVVFKSRCTTINLCFGLLSCNRKPKDEDDDDDNENQNNQNNNNNEENNNPPNP
tara:strand:- start:5114 stop:5440 length:327 start_codon:yes stop_codon:yes gene_type:complete